MIEKYLKNKETKITDDDLDITSLENDLRKGYVSDKEVQSRIDTAVKTANTDATTKYSQLENTYNDTVKNLNAVNEKNATLSLQMKMMKHGFKEENFDEISKLRKSLYADEKDDEKAKNDKVNAVKKQYKVGQVAYKVKADKVIEILKKNAVTKEAKEETK